MTERPVVLIVDDEPVIRESLAAWLQEDGYRTLTAASGEEAAALVPGPDWLACLVDLKMPGGIDGIETMRRLRARRPDLPVVIITAYGTIDTAVAAMKEGASDYVLKPFDPEDVSLILERIAALRRAGERPPDAVPAAVARGEAFHGIWSASPRMHALFALVEEVASLRSTVLIEGESGTGKEMFARAIHEAGNRARRPFVKMSCAALTETLLESELFGHEAGAFTGAGSRKRGKFEIADGGTLLLDEIGDISPKVQVDLLRVLQERRFFRVGGNEEIAVDVRFIAATNRPLRIAVREGRFREDLFYRLNVIHLQVPPLRERPEDIPLLANHFGARFAAEQGRPPPRWTPGALSALQAHRWPGNVRELENAVERAMVTSRGDELTADDFRFLREEAVPEDWNPPANLPLREVEAQVIRAVLQRTRWNITEAASILGIDRSTLYEKMRRYDIDRRPSRE
ncbi:MAG TPA: sigma-54 dependent transcriptional regulator [Myxococcota bacterium]|nr:sigma-54 dependent transcriptional regulator [Myxococcota bacterium]HQK51172.1 sigma-54 dependent transcriptional regulator [Myxococcota bacterium]